jgi:glycogen operon protein
VLTNVKLIAEPWDIGPGGYQLGAFPPPFMEWNDKYRDGVRRYWRGDAGLVPELADRLTGSATQFDHSGRPATASVNLLTAHDGFTLADVVSYVERHNEANGEDNRDGHGENFSDNFGVEGPSDKARVRAARNLRRRNMMATLLLSQGTPMILAGDEIGHTQGGNNNAYCQDNETGWIDWDSMDEEFRTFTKGLIAFRRAHPILRQKRFLHSTERAIDGVEDLFWWRPDGQPMTQGDWDDPEGRVLCAELRMASGSPPYAEHEEALYLVFNAGKDAVDIHLPEPAAGWRWSHRIATATGWFGARPLGAVLEVPGPSVAVCVLEALDG